MMTPAFVDSDDVAPFGAAGGRKIARNTIWNIAGQASPILVAIIVLPILIRSLGTAKYGVLAIAWAVIGYFGIFDMGLGSALTKMIAERVGENAREEIRQLFWTGFTLLMISSVIGSIVLVAISRPLAYSWLNVPTQMRVETFQVFRVFALGLPFVVTADAFRGVLAAYNRFDLINKVRIPLGILFYAGPVAILPFSRSLVAIIALLVVIRMAGWVIFLVMCLEIVPGLDYIPRPHLASVRPLVTFGGWITTCNVVEPLFIYSDRFLLGAMASMSAVAYYATPFDIVTKLWIIPDALVDVLFPAFAASLRSDGGRATFLLERSVTVLFPMLFVPILGVVAFAPEILTLWLGSGFAVHSARVLQWLALGVLINSMARAPYSLLQAAHRPDLPAKLLLIETPIYLGLLYVLIHSHGVEGAAVAWTIRMAINASALHTMTWYLRPDTHSAIRKTAAMLFGGALVLGCTALLPEMLSLKILYCGLMIAIVGLFTWFRLLSPEEKAFMVPSYLP